MNDAKTVADQAAKVAAAQATIKAKMPSVYKAIQDRAITHPKGTFALVKRGLSGEHSCFYAFEQGHVVGTPFFGHSILADVAVNMVNFGCAHVCIFAGVQDGAN